MTEERKRIPIDECVTGNVYKLYSRNLEFGVYDGDGGFSGIREKFGDRYLFTEYHWDKGAPYGTAHPQEDLGPLPEGMDYRECLGHVDTVTGRPIVWDFSIVRPDFDGRKMPDGWYRYLDGPQEEMPDYPIGKSAYVPNKDMFNYLARLEV